MTASASASDPVAKVPAERRSLSIRARIAIWYTLAFSVLLTVALGSGYLVLVRTTLDEVDAFLLESAGAVGSTLREALPSAAPESGATRDVADRERRAIERVLADYEFGEMGLAVFEQLPGSAKNATPTLAMMNLRSGAAHPFGGASQSAEAGAVALRASVSMQPERATLAGGAERVVAVPLIAAQRLFVVAVSQSLDRRHRTLAQVGGAILVGVPLSLLIASAGGYLLARASLQPVEAMREQAARIGEETLSARLPVASASDELGRLSRTFNELLDRVQAVFEHRKLFMADASHELRTPVAVLTAEVELALQQHVRSPAEYRAALSNIHAEARRLAHIVDGLLLLARGDAAEQEIVRTSLYLEELVADCADSLSLLARQKDITIRFAPAEEVPFVGDERLLRRMVVNMIENAVKYTSRGGRVSITLAKADSVIRVLIEDSGA